MTRNIASQTRSLAFSTFSHATRNTQHTFVHVPLWVRRCIVIVIAACWITSSLSAKAVQSVTLAWDRSSDTSAVGYRIYAYEENVAEPTSYNVLGMTQVTLGGLKEGLRYTFKVRSYNAAGVESTPSNSADVTVPVPLQIFPGATQNDLKRFQFPIAPGRWYELQSSTDLRTWTTIQQTAVASTYTWTEVQETPPPVKRTQRFFRLQVH